MWGPFLVALFLLFVVISFQGTDPQSPSHKYEPRGSMTPPFPHPLPQVLLVKILKGQYSPLPECYSEELRDIVSAILVMYEPTPAHPPLSCQQP